MKKLKKYQRVELFLENLLEQDDFTLDDLAHLRAKHIAPDETLVNIGERTISNCIDAFRKKHGIVLNSKRMPKKEILEALLDKKIKSGNLAVEELLDLQYEDLKSIEELEDVGKTMLMLSLNMMKAKYKNIKFEKDMLQFLRKETIQSSDTPTLMPYKTFGQ